MGKENEPREWNETLDGIFRENDNVDEFDDTEYGLIEAGN